MTKLGGWLFRHRTIIPVPLALLVLLVPAQSRPIAAAAAPWGVALIAAGEAVRLWGVRQIGAVSRTRSERLGPLVDSGPFALVRNPLYLGNIALWTGFALAARLPWLAPIVVAILAIEYHAIVGWEEQLLTARIGAPYQEYLRRVPRWVPALRPRRQAGSNLPRFSWRETIYSERGTLIGICVGFALLWLKARFGPV